MKKFIKHVSVFFLLTAFYIAVMIFGAFQGDKHPIIFSCGLIIVFFGMIAIEVAPTLIRAIKAQKILHEMSK